MLADTRKHDPVTDEAPLALYCFPEIASGGKPSMMYRSQTPFIGGSTRPAKIVMTPLVAEARADEPRSVDAADANETVDAKAPGPDIQALEAAAFDKGLEQGRAETAQELRETVENTVSALNTALASLEQVHRQSLQSMETEAVRLAIAIAKKIIGSESDKALVIQHVVRTAMEGHQSPPPGVAAQSGGYGCNHCR